MGQRSAAAVLADLSPTHSGGAPGERRILEQHLRKDRNRNQYAPSSLVSELGLALDPDELSRIAGMADEYSKPSAAICEEEPG